MLAVSFGILLGPYVTGLFDPRSWGGGRQFDQVTLEVTRIIVALDVFSVGVELPRAYILHHWRGMICLLGPVMIAGWFISAALIFALVPALTYIDAMIIAAAITPTDTLLASSVVGKGRYARKHVPPHLSHMLQAEAGSNDGTAIVLLYLAMFIRFRHDDSIGLAIGHWLLFTVAYHIILAIVMGSVAGIIARKTIKFSKQNLLIDKESMVSMYIALALLATGVSILAGTDDIVASFACGVAFAWDGSLSEEIEHSNFSEILSHLVNATVFIYVGATIPFASWNDGTLELQSWKMVVLALSILLLRRLPILVMLHKCIPDLKSIREAIFCGHFGPVGVSALFISALATTKLPTPNVPARSSLDTLALIMQPIMYLLVFCSVLIHGLSVPFFTMGKNVHTRVNSLRRSLTSSSNPEPDWLNRVPRLPLVVNDFGGALSETNPSETTAIRGSMSNCLAVAQEPDGDTAVEVPEENHENPSLHNKGDNAEPPNDAPIKKEERRYKSGNYLIVERDDGKELEVRGLQPRVFYKARSGSSKNHQSDEGGSNDVSTYGNHERNVEDFSLPRELASRPVTPIEKSEAEVWEEQQEMPRNSQLGSQPSNPNSLSFCHMGLSARSSQVSPRSSEDFSVEAKDHIRQSAESVVQFNPPHSFKRRSSSHQSVLPSRSDEDSSQRTSNQLGPKLQRDGALSQTTTPQVCKSESERTGLLGPAASRPPSSLSHRLSFESGSRPPSGSNTPAQAGAGLPRGRPRGSSFRNNGLSDPNKRVSFNEPLLE